MKRILFTLGIAFMAATLTAQESKWGNSMADSV